MKNAIFLLLFFCLHQAFSQVNESSYDRYLWSKKGTEPQPGYIVLKSGTKMEGTIELRGTYQNIKEIILVKEGKEVKIAPTSLKAYGLLTGELINESPEEMYEWRTGSTTTNMSGVQTINSSTKPRRGYVILNDGTRIDGELKLKKENNVLDEIVIKGSTDGKSSFKPAEVSKYGLQPTIADITKGGKKIFDEDGKNFYKGYYLNKENQKVEGMLAFMKSQRIPNSNGSYLYTNLYFSVNEEEAVTVIENSQLQKVVQINNSIESVYIPYKDGFVDEKSIGELSMKDLFRIFQPGRISLMHNPREITGEILQIKGESSDFNTTLNFKDEFGQITNYNVSDINYFEQDIKGKTHRFIAFNEIFVELIYYGEVFMFFNNPNPTTVNEKATARAKAGVNVAGIVGSSAAVGSIKGGDEKVKQDAVEMLRNMSDEQLVEQKLQAEKLKSAAQNQEQKNNITKLEIAIAAEQARRVSSEIKIMNVEYFAMNKKSGDKLMLTKANFEKDMENLLNSCESFLMMSKDEKSIYTKFEKLDRAMVILEECYK